MKFRYTIIFLAGFVSCAFVVFLFSYSNGGIAFGTGFAVYSGDAPSDWVAEDNIVVLQDRIILRIANATVSNYAGSGSMKPIFDEGANGIRVVPMSEEEVDVGDIVSFRWGGLLVVHRVVEKGFDEEGIYFVTKGDNNFIEDARIRFEDIEYVTVGVIW